MGRMKTPKFTVEYTKEGVHKTKTYYSGTKDSIKAALILKGARNISIYKVGKNYV